MKNKQKCSLIATLVAVASELGIPNGVCVCCVCVCVCVCVLCVSVSGVYICMCCAVCVCLLCMYVSRHPCIALLIHLLAKKLKPHTHSPSHPNCHTTTHTHAHTHTHTHTHAAEAYLNSDEDVALVQKQAREVSE